MIYKLPFLRNLINGVIQTETLNHVWNKLHFNSDQHTVQEFAQELDLLAALIGATNTQIIDKFKECFHQKYSLNY